MPEIEPPLDEETKATLRWVKELLADPAEFECYLAPALLAQSGGLSIRTRLPVDASGLAGVR